MIEKKIEWESVSGVPIKGCVWVPNKAVKALVVLVHGFGEHCMRYAPFIQLFEDAGIAFISFDQMGHGISGGKRGTITSYQDLLSDVDACIEKGQRIFPDCPTFIYGHSMGGNIVLNYLLNKKNSLKGAIVTSPWLELAHKPNALLEKIVAVLQNVIPNVTVDSGLKVEHMSTIKSEVEKYENDALNHSRISFRLFHEITNFGRLAISHSVKLATPTLLMHGSEDEITSQQASQQVAKDNPNIIFRSWGGCYHELHNDFCQSDVAQTIIKWMDAQQ